MDKLHIPIRGQSIYVEVEGEDHLPTFVFLHGFTGSSATWTDVRSYLKDTFRTIAIDLTGHGQTSIPNDPLRYSMEEQLADLDALFSALKVDDFHLVGYSMGGRIALAYSVHYPGKVSALLLESASPGLALQEDRTSRIQSDEKLAQMIIDEGITAFVNKWENIPLFQTQKSLSQEQQLTIRSERLRQNEKGLANSLRGIGTGSQPSYWGALQSIGCPVLLLTGEKDVKFVRIASEMKKIAQSWKHEVIPDAGHAIHVEKPLLFATMIKGYIQDLQQLEEDKK